MVSVRRVPYARTESDIRFNGRSTAFAISSTQSDVELICRDSNALGEADPNEMQSMLWTSLSPSATAYKRIAQ
jgi:hypothetical protein